MKKTPTISVIMSVYNAQNYVAASIESILAQTYQDFEFIIIDDGSTDDTCSVVKQYKDSRIKLISRENKGLIGSLNEGLQVSRGLYIARQDADDVSDIRRLEVQLEAFNQRPERVLVSTAFDMFTKSYKDPINVQILPYEDEDLRKALPIMNPFGHGSCMFRRETALKMGGYHNVEMAEDYDLWIRLAGEGEVYQVPQVLYHWRVMSGGITDIKSEQQAEVAKTLQHQQTIFVEKASAVIKRYYKYAHWAAKNGYASILDHMVANQGHVAKRLFKQAKFRGAIQQYRIYKKLKKIHDQRDRVFVVRNAFANDFGGAETYALNLSKALEMNGYKAILATQVPVLLDKSRSAGISTIYSRWNNAQGWSKTYMLHGLKTTIWYCKQIVNHKVNILHLQSRDDFIFGTIAGVICRKRIIWTDHGDLKYILRSSSPKSLLKAVLWCARKASAIIAVSESEKREIEKEYSLPNIKVVYNGVLPVKNMEEIQRKDKSIIFGTTSRLVDSKGLPELLQAFSSLEQLNTVLWLIGEGAQKKRYEKLAAQLGIKDRVMFWGLQPNVWSFLKSMDVFVMPTHHEAFSLSLVEAVVAGLPIICTDVGGNPEIAHKTKSVLVPAKDPQALKSAMEEVAGSISDFKVSAATQKKLQQRFDFYSIVKEEVIPLYEK